MALLVLLFIVVPIAELWVIIEVGQAIGLLPTLALLIADAVLGAMLARSQGRAAWRRFNLALAEGRVPARETADGAMIILGGALLLTPGFITDIAGLVLLIPPTRALIRRGLGTLARRRVAVSWRIGGAPPRRPEYGRRPDADYDFEGTAREVTEAERELPRGPGGA